MIRQSTVLVFVIPRKEIAEMLDGKPLSTVTAISTNGQGSRADVRQPVTLSVVRIITAVATLARAWIVRRLATAAT